MKKVDYCLVEDRKVLLCMEGFFCKIRDAFKEMCGGKYEIGFYIWKCEKR